MRNTGRSSALPNRYWILGPGRASLFLARKGFEVEAIDPSTVGMADLARVSELEGLPIQTFVSGFEDWWPERRPYSAILAFGIIPLLRWDAIHLLVERIQQWLVPGGLIFLSAFVTGDEGFKRHSRECEKIGRNSFLLGGGQVRTYLEPGELRGMLMGFDIIFYWEGTGQRHRHGKGPLEQHSQVLAVGRWTPFGA